MYVNIMKNILYMAPQNVIPPVDGGKIGIYYPLLFLSKFYDLYLFFIKDVSENVDINDYLALGIKGVEYCELDKKDRLINLLLNYSKKEPFKFQKYFNCLCLNKIDEIVLKNKIDLIICSHPHLFKYALYLKKKYNIKILLREHNLEYQLVYEYYKYEKNPVKKYIAYTQYIKTKKYETKAWNIADGVVFISDTDYKEAVKYSKNIEHFYLVYDGFIINKFKTNDIIKNREYEPFSCIFTGNLNTLQNRINLNWFIKSIWLNFIKKNYKYKLYITGNNDQSITEKLSYKISELNKINIFNLGFVKDIDAAISSKQFFISPSIIGSGIRIKILHALSLGVPVFATIKDYEMISLFDDMNNIIMFKDFEEFEIKINNLTINMENYNNIAINGFNLIKNNLSWLSYSYKMRDILKKNNLT